MYSLLLIIIYIAFISLGLPDVLLGSAWPSIHVEFGLPLSYAGIISMTIAGGTIVSSLFSGKLIQKFGTGKLTVISVGMTAFAIFGFSTSTSLLELCLYAIPYGLGAGSVDAALNNFVALHYKAMHMSWLHCFWGIGATLGPYIMGIVLVMGKSWKSGYYIVFIIQLMLTILLILTLPLWKNGKNEDDDVDKGANHISLMEILKLKNAKVLLIVYFGYCALESSAGLWAASYMVINRGISPEIGAKWASLFYLGITIGRFISGFITLKLNNKNMVRLGQILIVIGIVLMLLPLSNTTALIGLITIGLGCAPIYPSLLHETPMFFGAEYSQSIMGVQMASAYVGTTFMPPLFGFIQQYIGIGFYPLYLLIFVIIMIVLMEGINRKLKSHIA